MTTPNPTPNVGDKVIYVPKPESARLPLQPPWAERAERVSIIVGEEDGHGELVCWADWEDDCWYAPADRLRVVERASYTPVEDPDA